MAIIPDWNRTRARENWVSIPEAYWISYNKWVDLLEYTFSNTDVQVFTLRWLSTENAHKRPAEEYDFLMNMYKKVDSKLYEILEKNQINFKRIWNADGVTEWFRNYLNEKTSQFQYPNSNKRFVFWVNYWWRDEILRWIQKLAKEKWDLSNISEQEISDSLDLGHIPPIELVIRTKWDEAQRTSGFMSWWIGYAELFFTSKKCPELDIPTYNEALDWFDKMSTKRNFGK